MLVKASDQVSRMSESTHAPCYVNHVAMWIGISHDQLKRDIGIYHTKAEVRVNWEVKTGFVENVQRLLEPLYSKQKVLWLEETYGVYAYYVRMYRMIE